MPSVRSMPDAIQVWTIVGLSLLRASLCCIAANAPSRQEQQKTWQEKVWGKPNPRVLDDFELIDGFLLPARPTEGSDHALDSGLALPSGVRFVTPGKEDRAIYIHAFRPDIDGLWTRVRAKLLH